MHTTQLLSASIRKILKRGIQKCKKKVLEYLIILLIGILIEAVRKKYFIRRRGTLTPATPSIQALCTILYHIIMLTRTLSHCE